MRRLLLIPCLALLAAGCAHPLTTADRILATAHPLLMLDEDCVWGEQLNRLRQFGPDSIHVLMSQPLMQQPAAPDDLRLLVGNSLVDLLADPRGRPPLRARCFETTLGLLHFDIKVRGHSVGTVVLPPGDLPRCWHSLFPVDFNHRLAAEVDIEADRQALVAWWRQAQETADLRLSPLRMRALSNDLWPLLERRLADRWRWNAHEIPLLCSDGPDTALLGGRSRDYNLVRAACIYLGSRGDPAIDERLVELVGGRAPLLAYNAVFALGFSPNPRIRDLIRRYNLSERRAKEPVPRDPDRPLRL